MNMVVGWFLNAKKIGNRTVIRLKALYDMAMNPEWCVGE